MTDDHKMAGKLAVITGATSGIGYQAALALAHSGAQVIGVGRDPERCQRAMDAIHTVAPSAGVNYLVADLSRQSQVRDLAEKIQALVRENGHAGLDVLVNNAGIYAEKYIKTEDGVEITLAVNHMAPFLLTKLLMPLLMTAPSSCIQTVSSGSHFRTRIDFARLNDPPIYFGLWAYKVSKLANVLFTLELQQRLKGTQTRAFAVDPGLVNTEMGLKGTSGLVYWIWAQRRNAGVPAELPARTILYLASEANLPEALYWYNCQPAQPSRQAQRIDLALRLWEASEKMIVD